MRGARHAVSLIEVLVALAILAALTAPLIGNMLSARTSVHSSSKDVQAVILAGRLMSALQKIPYERLPEVGPGIGSDLEGPEPGIYRSSWGDVYMGEDGDTVDLVALLGAEDPEGMRSYVWIDSLPDDQVGLADVPAKQLVVTVRYRASGPKVDVERGFSLHGLVAPRAP